MTSERNRESAKRQSPTGRTIRSAQRGSSLVELAFVLVFLLTVLFGIVDFSRALYTYHFVSNVAREATRWASVRGSACNAALTGCQPGGVGADGADIQAFVSNVSGMGLDPAKITSTTSWVAPPSGTPACTGPENLPGCVVKVQVNYDYQFIFPFLPAGFRMSSTSQMVISQ
jgi:Flp pilus assembly protein TadG